MKFIDHPLTRAINGIALIIVAVLVCNAFPNLWTCSLRWALVYFHLFLIFRKYSLRWLGACSVGITMNALATLSNGGFMPVHPRYVTEDAPLWGRHSLLTESSNLPYLTDILPGGASIGDYVIIGTLLAWGSHYLINKWLHRNTMMAAETQ
jgi:hypothetical protein